jgi:hypothetical protein
MRNTNKYKFFLDWLKSDNVIKTKEGYRTQCSQYRIAMTKKELYVYFKHNYGRELEGLEYDPNLITYEEN